MTVTESTARPRILVAIDIAKAKHEVLVELPTGKRRKMIVRNLLSDFRQLAAYLKRLEGALEIALEPTADYHRNLAYFLKVQGFEVKLVSSIAVARTREALHNSWDKNDPKDAQVILHLLRNGNTQYFYDPVIEQTNDLQELSKTHFQVSLRKTRVQHSLLNHYLPLYFPEAERFLSNSRSSWFARLLLEFPTPQAITQLAENEFIEKASQLLSSKHSKAAILRALYAKAQESVALPVPLESQAIATFRLLLAQHLELCRIRAELEETAHELLQSQLDYSSWYWSNHCADRAGGSRRLAPLPPCAPVPEVLWTRSSHFTIGRLPRPHSIVEARQQQITLSSVDGCTMCDAHE
jgi:transposase